MSSVTTDPALSVLVSLPTDLARAIDDLAARRGQDRSQFIVSFLQEQLNSPVFAFEKLMAPIAEDFKRSSMTEEELDALVKSERQVIWDERHR